MSNITPSKTMKKKREFRTQRSSLYSLNEDIDNYRKASISEMDDKVKMNEGVIRI